MRLFDPPSLARLRLLLEGRWWLVWLGFAAVVVGGVAGGMYVLRAEARNLADARGLMERGEWRRAQLLLEQAVQVKPESVAAQVALAEFYDFVGTPQAADRWRVVVQLAAEDEYRWRWAAAALRVGENAKARKILDEVSAGGRDSVEQHRLLAGYELARGDRMQATQHLSAMVEKEPGNLRYRFSLASHRLALGEDVAVCRKELEQLAKDGPLRVRATLELMLDAPRRWPQAADPESLLAVQVLDEGRAVQLRAGGRAGRARLLAHLKAKPLPEPTDAAVLVSWLLREGREREALEWLDGFAPAQRLHPALLAPTAECAVRLRDWKLLEDAMRHGAWGVLAPGLARQAFALHEQSETGNRVRWQQLLGDPELGRAGLRVLWRLATTWGWAAEADLTASSATRRFAGERWAWEARRASLQKKGDRAELLRLLKDWIGSGGAPDEVATDFWVLTVLLDPIHMGALQEAEAFVAATPDSSGRLAVKALLRRREGRVRGGLDLLEAGVPAGGIVAPSRWWLAYGVLLAENGRAEEARRAFARVPGPLLPEEAALIGRVAGGR